MFELRITVTNRLGIFSGVLDTSQVSAAELTEENVTQLAEGIQKSVGNMNRLTLTQHDGSEITFPSSLLDQSIITTKIIEVE